MSAAVVGMQHSVLLACPAYKQRKLLGTWRLRMVEIVSSLGFYTVRYHLLIYKSAGELAPHQVIPLDSVSCANTCLSDAKLIHCLPPLLPSQWKFSFR